MRLEGAVGVRRNLDKGFRREERRGRIGKGERKAFLKDSGRKRARRRGCYGVGQPGKSFILLPFILKHILSTPQPDLF